MNEQDPEVKDLIEDEVEEVSVEEARGVQGGTFLPAQTVVAQAAPKVGPLQVSEGCETRSPRC